MANNATENHAKLPAVDNPLRTGYIAGPGTVVLCCAADLVSYSATARYVIREYGHQNIFRLRPAVGTAVRLVSSPTAPWSNEVFLLCTRASNRHPLLHEVLHTCLTNLTHQLHQKYTTRTHLSYTILSGRSTYHRQCMRHYAITLQIRT